MKFGDRIRIEMLGGDGQSVFGAIDQRVALALGRMNEFPRTLKIATVWLVIGVAVFLGVRAFEAQQSRTRIEVSGDTIELRRGPDGHYHWPGTVNGRKVDFLIDTGATTTTVPQSLADALDLPSLGRVQGSTANGPVTGTLTRADISLEGGIALSNLRLIALPALRRAVARHERAGPAALAPKRRPADHRRPPAAACR